MPTRLSAIAHSRFALWAAFLLVHLWLGLLNLHGPGNPIGDVSWVYLFWMEYFVDNGLLVGIDTQWVYPILALLPMGAAYALGPEAYTSTWLTLVMLLDLVALAVLTDAGRSDRGHVAGWWWTASLLLLGPVALGRVDSVSVPIAVVAVALLRRHPRVAVVLLAVGAWMKIWPAAIGLAVVVAARSRWQVLVAAVVTTAVVVVTALLLGSGSNVFSFVTQQTGRGLQVEAPVSTVYLWLAALHQGAAIVYYDTGILTFQVSGTNATLVASLMTPLLAVAVAAIAVLGIRAQRAGAATRDLLPPLALAVVTAFIVVNKVGSPQFEAWLVAPVVLGLLLQRGGFRVPAVLVLVIDGLTQVIYPYLYDQLLALHPGMLAVISLRNLLLIALLAWAVREVWRSARPVNVRDDGYDPSAV